MNEVLDELIKMRQYFASPDRWTKNVNARLADGRPTISDDPEAVCHCLLGYLIGFVPGDLERGVHRVIEGVVGWGSIVGFNDASGTDHAAVLRVIDDAIKLAAASAAAKAKARGMDDE